VCMVRLGEKRRGSVFLFFFLFFLSFIDLFIYLLAPMKRIRESVVVLCV